ncbi:hypothetical protein ACFLS7_04355 [Bacteroidota bacterium]
MKISKVLFESKGQLADAVRERGARQLMRVGIITDVLFALMIFQIFMFLPRPEVDQFDATNLVQVLTESYVNYLVMLVGIILILTYWNQHNLQFGNLEMTDGRHSTLSILQVVSLMVYLYFIRLDMELGTQVILLLMQSIFLALAGFFSIWSLHYAVKSKMISGTLSKEEINGIYLKIMPEPVVSVLTIPFAWISPLAWTLSWLLLIPVSYFLKKIRARQVNSQPDK